MPDLQPGEIQANRKAGWSVLQLPKFSYGANADNTGSSQLFKNGCVDTVGYYFTNIILLLKGFSFSEFET